MRAALRRLACAMLAVFGACTAAAAAEPVQWKLATGYRAESFHTQNLQQFAGDVRIASSGALVIEVHPNNTLAKLAEIRAAVERGQAEAGETIMSSLAPEMPIAGADSVPFITESYAEARRMWRHQRPLIERHFAARGLQVLYAVPWPPQGLYTSKPVMTTADLAGCRMRTYNPTTQRIAVLVGAQPVDVAMVDVAKALADGRIDCMLTSAVTGAENKVWSHLRCYYEINAWFPKNIVFVNAAALQVLPASSREALLKVAAVAEVRGWAASEAAAAASVDELRRNGMKIERVPREFNASIKRLGERFSLEWLRQVGGEANHIFVPYFAQQ